MHALDARTWNPALPAGEGLDVVRPHSGGVDDDRGADVDDLVGLDVAHLGADDAPTRVMQPDDLGGVQLAPR